MPHILIIEDNANNLELMRYILNASGYTISQAINGDLGWKMLQQEKPDLILCDLQMPVMDGYTLAKHIKNDIELRNIPLIAVTAYSMVGDKEHILKSGFDGYIPKPITPETFANEIADFLTKKKYSAHSAHNASLHDTEQ